MDEITYTTDKDCRGRRTGTTTAHLGADLIGTGADKATAKQSLYAAARRAVENRNARAFFCGSGEVLVLRFAYDCWTYSIARNDGSSFSPSCHSSADYPEACEQVRRHADGSYGGVVFERSL